MRNQGQIVFGLIVILIGVLLLIGNVFRIDIGKFFWPSALILVGVWLLSGARLGGSGRAIEQRILGEIQRDGNWQVKNEELWCLVGEIELDMTDADIPPGETRLRTLGFVGDVELLVPAGVGVAVLSTAFVSDVKFFGQKRESILAPLRVTSDDYASAKRKILLETAAFVGDVKVRRA
ncbi:MAG: cell wall-active antibiotics response protein [Thermoflexales bacterium]|nr:cell wall-active antibiotics response protein [Thermoflexales bacterium]